MLDLIRGSAMATLVALSSAAWGGELAGLWQEYDDQTGKVEALIRIEKAADGTYEGRIEKLVPDAPANASKLCTACKDGLRGKPLVGLRILSGMKRADELNFDGGEIVDPEDGKAYRCHIRLSADGKTIEVTGYVGAQWLGQSETWRRADGSQ